MVAASPALDRSRPIWRAVATSVVPEASQLGAAEWAAFEAIVARALAARPARTRRQVALFLTLLDWLPLLRYGRRLFWGIRTLVLMGYYGRPAAAAAIGYRADPRGWEARR